jgi:hypothetical protein
MKVGASGTTGVQTLEANLGRAGPDAGAMQHVFQPDAGPISIAHHAVRPLGACHAWPEEAARIAGALVDCGKSDPAIVATKPANKAEQPTVDPTAAEPNAVEPVERRAGATGTHTESRKGKEEGEVHRTLPPHQHPIWRLGITVARRSQNRNFPAMEASGADSTA